MLAFDAYFQESINEVFGYNHLVRKCKIYFYLEDGTIKVVEPKVANSGIPQGKWVGLLKYLFTSFPCSFFL